MARGARFSRFTDGLITVLFVLAALPAAGAIGSIASEESVEILVASLLFVAMISAYSIWNGPGRRSPIQSFMLGGIALLPIAFGLMWVILAMELYDWGWALVGGHVGYHPGGMDSGYLFGSFVWWLSILLLIAIALAPRAVLGLYGGDSHQ